MLKMMPGLKLRVYTAGPDGFSESTRAYHRRLIKILKQADLEILDPWALTSNTEVLDVIMKASLNPRNRAAEFQDLNQRIGQRNESAIKRADIIVANLDGQEVDSGTASEIGFGYACGAIIFGIRSDFRQSGENDGCLINLQVEYFIRNSGGKIFRSLKELKAEITNIYRSGQKARESKKQKGLFVP